MISDQFSASSGELIEESIEELYRQVRDPSNPRKKLEIPKKYRYDMKPVIPHESSGNRAKRRDYRTLSGNFKEKLEPISEEYNYNAYDRFMADKLYLS